MGGVGGGHPLKLNQKFLAAPALFPPADKPRYLMGVGTYREMAKAIAAGIDLFDCVIPTRLGRHGAALVQGERWNLKNARFRDDFTSLDATCPCYCCQHFTRAYLNHLVRSKEVLGITLISLHNVTELIRFTQRIRESILNDSFTTEFADWIS